MFQEATSVEEVPINLNEGNELVDINLHSVDSISDLHWAPTLPEFTKSVEEGNSPSGSGTPRILQTGPKSLAEEELKTFPLQQLIGSLRLPGGCCVCCRFTLPTLLTVLLLGGIFLAASTLWLSVQQNESLRALSQQLASQEKTVLQIKFTSSQLWKWLNPNVTRHVD